MRFLFPLLVFALALAGVASAVPVDAAWDSASGPVVSYDLLVSRDGGATYAIEGSVPAAAGTVRTVIDAPIGTALAVKVAARAADGRNGPTSEPSDVFVVPDLTPLGQPGKVKLSVTITVGDVQ